MRKSYFICDKCGRTFDERPQLPDGSTYESMFSVIDMCKDCLDYYVKNFLIPEDELRKKRLEWLSTDELMKRRVDEA